MAYILQAFIIKESDEYVLTDLYQNAFAVSIGEQLSLIPLSSELYKEINKDIKSNDVGEFDSLKENMEVELLKHIGNIKLAYIEADYFGGRGAQIGIIWEENKRIHLSSAGGNEINKVLRDFGVVAANGIDEFDAVSLGRYRRTEQWLNDKK